MAAQPHPHAILEMGEYKTLLVDRLSGGITVVKLNRPTKLNALNIELITELRSVFEWLIDDPATRGIIITGEGEKAFAAGADIAEIAALNEVNARKFAERGQDAFDLIEDCNKPVLAAINGFALGGGCELAMACHMRVAVAHAKFGQPEVNLGLIPGYGGTQRLTQLVGKGKAMELMMTADMITAAEAHRIGLVNHVVEEPAELMAFAQHMMAKILSKAPVAIGHIINCVNSFYTDDDGFLAEANAFAACCRSDDFKEGTAAFLEKRPAAFKGR